MKHYELLAQLLIVLLASFGLMRAFEWTSRSSEQLKQASDIYITLDKYMDIQTVGWILLIGSIILLASVFTRGMKAHVMMVVGSLTFGIINLYYGAAASQDALLIETVYRSNLLGVFGLIVASIGVWSLWQTTKKKK